MPSSPKQIQQVRQLIKASGRKIWLEVDGGINPQTVITAKQAGADAFVAGNAVFGQKDLNAAMQAIRAGLK